MLFSPDLHGQCPRLNTSYFWLPSFYSKIIFEGTVTLFYLVKESQKAAFRSPNCNWQNLGEIQPGQKSGTSGKTSMHIKYTYTTGFAAFSLRSLLASFYGAVAVIENAFQIAADLGLRYLRYPQPSQNNWTELFESKNSIKFWQSTCEVFI